ncbi:hypothetical protein ACLM44_12610 [Synechococcus sp. W2B2]|uniref:hypothetical protein n=1 Tax=unclassified Synechococcus TaxID=2626047 RepID=UPI00006BB31E|nr:hypothetical protein [Synechococcus sp. WH 7805]EAR19899.1 hypothetical protein WH7805_13303 [Synechococcus sp. WH 7805]
MTITELPRMGSGRVSEARRLQFHADVREVVAWMRQYVGRLGFAPVARSWLYALESEGIITKGDFTWAGKWLADRRKEGLIPFELVGADSTRALSGHDAHDEEETPREYINRQLRDSLDRAKRYWPSSYWKHQEFFPIIWTEKRDLIKLFEPELPHAVRRFASKGQADVNSRVALIEECKWAESHHLIPVILFCGDLDPMGVRMSDAILENLMPLAKVLDWEYELKEMADDGRIIRFGLNAEFVDNAGLLWIDGLETSSGEDLSDPKHKHHDFPYVQSYLREYGARKVEANSIIASPTAARALIRDELWRWLCHFGDKQWREENRRASTEAAGHVDAITRMLAMFDSVGALYNPRRLEQAVNNGVASLPPSPE